MRWADMEVGGTYRLNTGRKLTLLETPADLRSRGRALVRFEGGVLRGEMAEVACVRIVEPWDRPAPDPTPVKVRPKSAYVETANRPECGNSVKWKPSTGEIIWSVTEIHEERAAATIVGELLGGAQTHTVPLNQLVVVQPACPEPISSPVALTRSTEPPASEAIADRELAPERPRGSVEELLDGLLFSTHCLDEYRRRCAPDVPREAIADSLREEIRRKGYIASERRGQPLRLRVEHRFEILVPEASSGDEPASIEALHYLKRGHPRQRQRRA